VLKLYKNFVPHIESKDANQGDVAILNNFIKNETEPWELALQNQNVGSHARSNYIYKVHRRARVSIVAGYHVTPMTNDGDYVAESNADINLRAGQSITLKPGVHFKAGSVDHLKIEYVSCGD
jgi:hypothetical protein